MQLRLLLLLLGTGILVFDLRTHICELGEVVRTYATFQILLGRNPNLLYRYQDSEQANNEAQGPYNNAIPRVMHHIALGNVNLSQYTAMMHSCISLHPGWTHMLWMDENGTDLIRDKYPYILPHYTRYPQDVQRADILRYAHLHSVGGVYLDLDVTCREALDSTPILHLPFVTPAAHPAGINNAFMASRPGHQFLTDLLDAVPPHNLFWGLPMRIPYVETMFTTGCMFLSNQWMRYVFRYLGEKRSDAVYVLANQDGDVKPQMLRGKTSTPLFMHNGSSSWHSWDATFFLLVGRHYILSIGFIVALVVLVVDYLCNFFKPKQGRRGRGGILFRLTRSIMRLAQPNNASTCLA